MMARLLLPMLMLSLLSIGAIFGFFYAWICSIMWGLDTTAPLVAITAMQAMNASVRNPVFFSAFFLTPLILAATSYVATVQQHKRSALLFGLAAGFYTVGAFLVTVTINVPLNEGLAEVVVPTDTEAARAIWQGYSSSWQFWNTLRTVVSGVSLLLTGLAIYLIQQDTE
jgi:uncharacterized membrane protein